MTTKPTTSDMTVSEILSAVWNQGRSHTSQHSAVTEALAAIEAHYAAIRKADMEKLIREAQPGTHTDIEGTDDLEWRGYVKGIHDYETNLKRMAERLNNTEEV